MSEQSLLERAIAAARAGRQDEVRQLLEQVLQANPYNEQAWLWMSGVAETDAERIGCLQQALALNPENTAARQRLAQLQARVEMGQPARKRTPGASKDRQAGEPTLWPIPEPPPPDQGKKAGSRSKGLLIAMGIFLALGLIGICGLGASIAYKQFFDGRAAAPTVVPVVDQVTNTPEPLAATEAPSTEQPDPTSTPRPTTTPMPTRTPELTATPIPSPTPCTVPVYDTFSGIWQANESQLGCPVSTGRSGIWVAQEGFQHGLMIWREDNDKIYVLYHNGSWERYNDIWHEGDPPFTCGTKSSPPTPQRGFGKIWCTYDAVCQGLGDAINAEWGEYSAIQEFSGGLILQMGSGKTYTFYSDGTWR